MNNIINIKITEEALNDLIKLFNRKMNSHFTFHSARIEDDKILISSSTMSENILVKNEQAIVIPFIRT